VLDNELNHFSVVGDGILTVSSQPERVQFWNSSNGQLIWEYDLDETMGETFGMTKPITWQSGQVAVAVGENKLVKLSNEGKELWTWTRDDVSE
jgi:outer membrane protein assembly factor BamB